MQKNISEKHISDEFDIWCDVHGNQKKLADYCEVTPQAVGQWRLRIPAERVFQIERVTGISWQRLRPDMNQQAQKVCS